VKRPLQATAALLVPVLLVYPILFHLLHERLGLAGLGVLLGALVLGRLFTLPGIPAPWRVAVGAAAVAFVLAVLHWRSSDLLELYPVAVNAVLLAYGLYTLRYPPSAIERLMRALDVPVSDAGVGYTRNVTILWCIFFAANGAVAGYLALAASTAAWAWYNGAVSYLLAGVLFAVEFVFRGFYKRRVLQRDSAGAGDSPSRS